MNFPPAPGGVAAVATMLLLLLLPPPPPWPSHRFDFAIDNSCRWAANADHVSSAAMTSSRGVADGNTVPNVGRSYAAAAGGRWQDAANFGDASGGMMTRGGGGGVGGAQRRPYRHRQQQQQQQHTPRQHNNLQSSSLYAEFDRKMEQLHNYARDRADSTGWNRLHQQQQQQYPAANAGTYDEDELLDTVGDNNADSEADIADIAGIDSAAPSFDENANRPKRRIVEQQATHAATSASKFGMGKVLNVLVPLHITGVAAAARNRFPSDAVASSSTHVIHHHQAQTASDGKTANDDETDGVDDPGTSVHERVTANMREIERLLLPARNWHNQATAGARTALPAVNLDAESRRVDTFVIPDACEICATHGRRASGGRSAGGVQQQCCGEVGKKAKRQAGAKTTDGAGEKPTTAFEQTRKLLNSNPSSMFPAVVLNSSPDLASYKKLMMRSGGDAQRRAAAAIADRMQSQQQQQQPSSQSYADFLNYFERQQQQQEHKHNQLNGLTLRTIPENGTAPNITTTTATPRTGATATNKPESWSTGTANRLEPPSSSSSSVPVPAECVKYMEADNASASVLQRVLDELERIRSEKLGTTDHPEGAPCNILGSWNSEIIGLRFDIGSGADGGGVGGPHNATTPITFATDARRFGKAAADAPTTTAGTTTTTTSATNGSPPVAAAATPSVAKPSMLGGAQELSVQLFDHNPPKRNPLMDTNWTCTGRTLNPVGGPFMLQAVQQHDKVLATFTGVCKICGGIETIFGTWNIVRPMRDCRDLQTALETKRDIFRKELLYVKKLHRLEQLRQHLANGSSVVANGGGGGGGDRTPDGDGGDAIDNAQTEMTQATTVEPLSSQRKHIHSVRLGDDDGDDDDENDGDYQERWG